MDLIVICLACDERLLVLRGGVVRPVAGPPHPRLHEAPQPQRIQGNTERHCQEAEPDNVVRVEVGRGKVGVGVVHAVVNLGSSSLRLDCPATP